MKTNWISESLEKIAVNYGPATKDIIKSYVVFDRLADHIKKDVELTGGFARRSTLFIGLKKERKEGK